MFIIYLLSWFSFLMWFSTRISDWKYFCIYGDPSSAAFFTALTLLKNNSYLKITNVGLNPTRIGFYSLLKKSGAKIKFVNKRKVNNEKVGDIIVKSSVLKPINASAKYYLNTTDEYPILFIISAFIKGSSFFSGISDLQNKERELNKATRKYNGAIQ